MPIFYKIKDNITKYYDTTSHIFVILCLENIRWEINFSQFYFNLFLIINNIRVN